MADLNLSFALRLIDEATAPLRQAVAEARGSAEQLAPAAEGIEASAAAAAEVAEGAQAFAQVAEAQAEATAEVEKAVEDAAAAAEQLAESTDGAAEATEKASEAAKRHGDETRKATRAQREAAKAAKEHREFLRELASAARQARQGTLSLGQAFDLADQAGKKYFDSAAKLTQAAAPLKETSRAILGSVKAAVDAAGGFEAAIARAGAAARATDGELAALRAAAYEVGSSATHGAQGAAESLAALGGVGLDARKQILALSDALKVAEVTGLGAAEAGEGFARIIRGFKVHTSQYGALADIITSATDSKQALDALGASAAAAQMSGFGLGAAASMFEGLKAGGMGADAGGGMQQVFEALARQNTQQLLQGAGIKLVDAEGSRRAMGEILTDLDQRLDGLDAGRRAEALDRAFGGGSKAVEMALKNLDAIRAREAELADPKLLESASDKKRATLLGYSQLADSVASSFDGLKSSVGDALLPLATSAAEALKSAIDATSEFIREHPTMTKMVAGATVAFGGLIGMLGGVMSLFAAVASARGVIKVVGVLGRLAGVTKIATGAGKALSVAAGGIKTALAAALSPAGLLVAAILGLAYAIAVVVKNWDHYSVVWKGYLQGMLGVSQTIATKIIETFRPALEFFGMDVEGRLATIRELAAENLQAGMDAADLDARDGGLKLWKPSNLFGDKVALPSESIAGSLTKPSGSAQAASGRIQLSVDVSGTTPRVTVKSNEPGIEISPRAGTLLVGAP